MYSCPSITKHHDENYYLIQPLIKSSGVVWADNNRYSSDEKNTLLRAHDGFSNPEIKEEELRLFHRLEPVYEIQEKIEYYTKKYHLDENVLGIQVRGTTIDYELKNTKLFNTEGYYISILTHLTQTYPGRRILLCSDDIQLKNQLLEKFPTAFGIPDTEGTFGYYVKVPPPQIPENVGVPLLVKQGDWYFSSKESVQYGIIEMYLLAQTTFITGHPWSTFAACVRNMSNYQ